MTAAQRLPLDHNKPYTPAQLDTISSRQYKRLYIKRRKFEEAQKIVIDVNHILGSEWYKAVAKWDTVGVDWYEVPSYYVANWNPIAFDLAKDRFKAVGIKIAIDSTFTRFAFKLQ